jgi:hypothetical protein
MTQTSPDLEDLTRTIEVPVIFEGFDDESLDTLGADTEEVAVPVFWDPEAKSGASRIWTSED